MQMRFFHTFWSKPLLCSDKFMPEHLEDNSTENWVRSRIVEYALSAECVHAHGYKITLVTDSFGKQMFDKIPYDDIIIIDDCENDNPLYAAQFKFKALKYANIGDVLIDGDLFLLSQHMFDKLEKTAKTHDIVFAYMESFTDPESCEGFEWACDYCGYMGEKFKEAGFTNLDSVLHLPNINDIHWYNTSLLQINNDFAKKTYVEQYFTHMHILQKVDILPNYWPDIILEQYFLMLLSNANNYKTISMMPENYVPFGDNPDFLHIGPHKTMFIEAEMDLLKDMNREIYDYVNDSNNIKEILKNQS